MPDSDDDTKRGRADKPAAADPDPQTERPLPEVRRLTRNELEALRARLDQKFH